MDVAENGDARGAGEEGDAASGAVDFGAGDVDDDEEEEDEERGGVGGVAGRVDEELDCSVDHHGGSISQAKSRCRDIDGSGCCGE